MFNEDSLDGKSFVKRVFIPNETEHKKLIEYKVKQDIIYELVNRWQNDECHLLRIRYQYEDGKIYENGKWLNVYVDFGIVVHENMSIPFFIR